MRTTTSIGAPTAQRPLFVRGASLLLEFPQRSCGGPACAMDEPFIVLDPTPLPVRNTFVEVNGAAFFELGGM